MDRIQQTRPLPEHFVPTRPRTIELEYVLSPEVARGGVTQHFKHQQVFFDRDGSAIVKVASENLFTDLRKLLHYGAACKVVGGDEAVQQMKEITRQMAQLYELM
jgi:predicted DNA-binding transcriptional regulator YafY